MKITLTRLDATDHGVFGHMELDFNTFKCVTLERHDIDIPKGTYGVMLYQSPVHGLIPLLKGVPRRDYIEIHEGNWEHDSKGCILVGSHRDVLDKTMIDEAKVTLRKLVNVLEQCKEGITITIV